MRPQYHGPATAYQDNEDGTVTDLNTGLMWQKHPGAKMSYDQALAHLSGFELAGYTDWRLPTINELYWVQIPLCEAQARANGPGTENRADR